MQFGFGTPKWAAQLHTALQSLGGNSLAQLATVRSPNGLLPGRPACRTVNVRSFKEQKLYFLSDLRSGKANDIINGNPHGELCLFFPQLQHQFRVSGTVSFVSKCEQSNAVWDSLSDRERIWWTWPTPGGDWAGNKEFKTVPPQEAPDHFCVCELSPDYVEVLDLSKMPFVRECSILDSESTKWLAKRINP